MDSSQLELVREEQRRPRPKTVFAGEFATMDRTLIYGYTVERDTFHVYAKDGELHKFIYRTERPKHGGDFDRVLVVVLYERRRTYEAQELSPSKAIYWERSDFDLCMKLARLEAYMHFTTSGEAVAKRTEVPQFEGVTYDPEIHTTFGMPRTSSFMG